MMGIIGSQIGQFMERKQAEDELRKSRDQLEAIFQGVSEGIAVLDPAGPMGEEAGRAGSDAGGGG